MRICIEIWMKLCVCYFRRILSILSYWGGDPYPQMQEVSVHIALERVFVRKTMPLSVVGFICSIKISYDLHFRSMFNVHLCVVCACDTHQSVKHR